MKIETFTEEDIREAVQGCGKQLLAEVVALAKSEGYENLYLWTIT